MSHAHGSCMPPLSCNHTCNLTLIFQLYGEPLPEHANRYMPSRQVQGIDCEAMDADKSNRDSIKAQKVRDAIICCECSKPRCVYSMQKLSTAQVK